MHKGISHTLVVCFTKNSKVKHKEWSHIITSIREPAHIAKLMTTRVSDIHMYVALAQAVKNTRAVLHHTESNSRDTKNFKKLSKLSFGKANSAYARSTDKTEPNLSTVVGVLRNPLP